VCHSSPLVARVVAKQQQIKSSRPRSCLNGRVQVGSPLRCLSLGARKDAYSMLRYVVQTNGHRAFYSGFVEQGEECFA
jgi:hypothetical protein